MSQRRGMGRGGEGGSRLSGRRGGPGGGTSWYCTSSSSADGTRHVLTRVPAGRAMDATAGTLRVGAVDATAGDPSSFSFFPIRSPRGGGGEEFLKNTKGVSPGSCGD